MSQTLHPYVHPKLVAKIRDLAADKVAHGSLDPMFTQKWQDEGGSPASCRFRIGIDRHHGEGQRRRSRRAVHA